MSRLVEDVEFLAGRLPHRGANTENERVAAEYIFDRFKEHTGDVAIDDFYSLNNFYHLVALYYFDFLFVTLFALWSPWAALSYGAVIFLMYMAEITAYPVMSRMLPQYETQNVAAQFLCTAPRRHLVLMANYDSPRATYLTAPERASKIRMAHFLLVCCMVAVLLSCVADGVGFLGDPGAIASEWVRWGGATVLIGAAFVLLLAENDGEYTRGANNNASGVAVLLRMAERLEADALSNTDVTLLATGAKETWLSGIQHFLRERPIDKDRTYFLNIDAVGAGDLRYLRGEGMLHLFGMTSSLCKIAEEEGGPFGAEGLRYRGLPTDALATLVRGYDTLGITAVGEDGRLPVNWKWVDDGSSEIDASTLDRAANYVESIVRRIDRDAPR